MSSLQGINLHKEQRQTKNEKLLRVSIKKLKKKLMFALMPTKEMARLLQDSIKHEWLMCTSILSGGTPRC